MAKPAMILGFYQPTPSDRSAPCLKPYLRLIEGVEHQVLDEDYMKATQCYLDAMGSFEQTPRTRTIICATANLACAVLGDRTKFTPAEHAERSKQLMEMFHRVNYVDGEVAMRWGLVEDALVTDKTGEALRLAEISVEQSETGAQAPAYYFARAQLASVLARLKRNKDANDVVIAAYEKARASQVPDMLAYPIVGLYGQYLLSQNDPQCIPLLERVISIDQGFGDKLGLTQSLKEARSKFADRHQ